MQNPLSLLNPLSYIRSEFAVKQTLPTKPVSLLKIPADSQRYDFDNPKPGIFYNLSQEELDGLELQVKKNLAAMIHTLQKNDQVMNRYRSRNALIIEPRRVSIQPRTDLKKEDGSLKYQLVDFPYNKPSEYFKGRGSAFAEFTESWATHQLNSMG